MWLELRSLAGPIPVRIWTACCLRVLQLPQAIVEIARVDRPQKAFDHLRQREPLAGGDAAAPDRVGDHLYRAEDVGRAVDRRQSELDRTVAARRSRQSRNAVGSPARASSTALRLSAVASPSSNSCAARVDRLIEPRGRPPGFPDCPFANGRPRTLLAVVAVFCPEISTIAPPRSVIVTPAAGCPLERRIPCDYGNFVVAA